MKTFDEEIEELIYERMTPNQLKSCERSYTFALLGDEMSDEKRADTAKRLRIIRDMLSENGRT